jgi:hypothetical protein
MLAVENVTDASAAIIHLETGIDDKIFCLSEPLATISQG